MTRDETLRITLSMAAVCAIGAGVLGGVYLATDRYQKRAAALEERHAIAALLALDDSATVTEVRQLLAPERREVVYRIGAEGAGQRELVFTLEGALARQGAVAPATEALLPLGRMFVARRAGEPAGYVVEGTTRGYKNRIRFLVGVTPEFTIAGVRVLEHEEDPGLGAEVATPEFQGQFVGRAAAGVGEVTRDPMPEDWRVALAELRRTPIPAWRERHADLLAREADKPVYAVTGATISSRALTHGVRETLDHFRRRWTLLAPHLGAPS
jgi:H+/Na+-translocating ferredoxin:NAD+ oxidoreductase subunit G